MHDELAPDIRGLEADAYEQSGYFSIDQAHTHGVSRQLLDHHVRKGRFQRVRRGLYRIRGFPTSQYDDIREGWMAVGTDKALVSHESALALLELSDNIPDKVHLLVARKHRGLRRPPGVAIHTHPDDEKVPVVWRGGIALTAPTRTLLDVAGRLQPEQAAMAIRQALNAGLLTRRQLEQAATPRGKIRALETIVPEL